MACFCLYSSSTHHNHILLYTIVLGRVWLCHLLVCHLAHSNPITSCPSPFVVKKRRERDSGRQARKQRGEGSTLAAQLFLHSFQPHDDGMDLSLLLSAHRSSGSRKIPKN